MQKWVRKYLNVQQLLIILYYIIEVHKEILIDDYKNDKYSYDLKDARFIPNHSIEMVNNYIDYTDECGIIKDRSLYGTEKNDE